MTDHLDPQQRVAEPHTQVTSGANYWTPSKIQLPPDKPPAKERIFPRKVIIGWALATAAVYFGVQIAKTVIKESLKQAAVYTTGVETTPDNRQVIYVTPNGRLIITKDRRTGQITIRKAANGHPIVAPKVPPEAASKR